MYQKLSNLCQINKYPWLVRVGDKLGSTYCGGTLVASKYVISAAHCFQQVDQSSGLVTAVTAASDVRVWIGDHNLETSGETSLTEKTVDVVSLIHHDNYQMTLKQLSMLSLSCIFINTSCFCLVHYLFQTSSLCG